MFIQVSIPEQTFGVIYITSFNGHSIFHYHDICSYYNRHYYQLEKEQDRPLRHRINLVTEFISRESSKRKGGQGFHFRLPEPRFQYEVPFTIEQEVNQFMEKNLRDSLQEVFSHILDHLKCRLCIHLLGYSKPYHWRIAPSSFLMSSQPFAVSSIKAIQ